MAKYNITEKKEKDAAYRALVNPKLMDELERRINDIIIVQKKFRDKSYSAKQLAEDLNTNTRYISAVVNVRFHMNYTSYVNKFRIQEAMSMLVDKRYQELNMEEISDLVGFSNRQSFYAAFFRLNASRRATIARRESPPCHPKTASPRREGGRPGLKTSPRP